MCERERELKERKKEKNIKHKSVCLHAWMSVVFVLLYGPNLEAFFLHGKKRGSVFNSFLSFQTRQFFGQLNSMEYGVGL